MAERTIVQTFADNARNYADDLIIKYKKERGGAYVDLTWKELKQAAFSFAAGLVSIGLEPGDRVAILSFNRLEWIVADLGTMLAGGVVVPIYHTNTAEQCAYVIEDAGARFVVVEDSAQLAKMVGKDNDPEGLRRTILIEGTPEQHDDRVTPYATFISAGAEAATGDEVKRRSRQVRLDDLATIVYTSGTTGPPKGCMITHRNIAAVLESIHALIRIDPRANLSLMILPLSHLYPRVSGYYYNIFMNIPLAIAESVDTLAQNMKEVRPTYFTSVPRIFEKVHDRIVGAAEKGSALKRMIFRWAVEVGRQRSRKLNAQQPLPPILRLKFGIADTLVFRKIRDLLGGRLWFAVSAGAPLSVEVGEFIHSLGIQVLEFYALTETITGTMTTFDACRFGTVGKPMPGCDVKLSPDGEILIRGNLFMGYWNKPELTAEMIKDGWCYTGDVGRWDEDGFLIITDRKKDLIITSGGKNISPQNIENMLKRIPLVSIPMVYGDNKKYLTALITLDRVETEAFAREKGLSYATYDELVHCSEIKGHIQTGMEKVNHELAQYETIKKFIILPREFSQDLGEITPTLKLKRKPILEKYRDLLDSLYDEQG